MSDSKNDSNSNNKDSTNSTNDSDNFNPKDWGYDMYPERGEKYNPSIGRIILGDGKENIQKLDCEKSVYECIKKSPVLKLLMGALKANGCEFDLRRHISCEMCDRSVTGGYDPMLNQIVVCQNTSTSKNSVHGTLMHEMVHMFDYCKHKLDFRNHEHLACTEIRAANIAHCSYLSGLLHGFISPIKLKQQHQECVADRATWAVKLVRKLSYEEARVIVETVFTRCYNDLEPLGRRIKAGSSDGALAFSESCQLGYDHYSDL